MENEEFEYLMSDEENKDYIMHFGKHQGKRLEDIPLLYLDWVNGLKDIMPETSAAINGYLNEPVIAKELDRQVKKKNEENE